VHEPIPRAICDDASRENAPRALRHIIAMDTVWHQPLKSGMRAKTAMLAISRHRVLRGRVREADWHRTHVYHACSWGARAQHWCGTTRAHTCQSQPV